VVRRKKRQAVSRVEHVVIVVQVDGLGFHARGGSL